ncbi:carboxymuconolactone decarboxylase [Xylophilus sp. Kf1]|nr:carboxymuconolactone decarboxylase [Xylophilus sp. Kf1]
MRSTRPAETASRTRRGLIGVALAAGLDIARAQAPATARDLPATPATPTTPPTTMPDMTTKTPDPRHAAEPDTLTPRQAALGPLAAATAIGDMDRLPAALARGLDAGLTLGETKEALVQLYAYAGFPRSLNALGELMKLADARRQRGITDPEGAAAGPVPVGAQLLAAGTANQTRLAGAPVSGPLFDFAPAIDQFLKTHLFGDIFARDNLDWQSRELVTVAALAALPGVESQLLSHVRIGQNIGLTPRQLAQLADTLGAGGFGPAQARLQAALAKFAEDGRK